MNIGIERDHNLIYEATTRHGYPVWPSPVLFQVVIASEEDDVFTGAKVNYLGPNSLLFREETYNSSSRVRRGRLYQAGGAQPTEWFVYPHPAMANELHSPEFSDGTIRKTIFEFSSLQLRPYLQRNNLHRPIFVLGAENGFTIWTLVDTETTATGDEIIVLRARKSVGALPHLNREAILQADGKRVLEFVDKLEEELYRAGPESIIDRSREAATAILSRFLQMNGGAEPGKDLGKLANAAEKEHLEIVANSAKIIARLHARAKHAEQEQRAIRPVTEQDAEFAVHAVGTILCDLGWAKW